MRSRIIIKCNFWLEVFAEKIMEWLEFLRYKARNRKEYSSSLVEVYTIYKRWKEHEFVKEFLSARTQAIKGNRYGMVINTVENNSSSEEEIGKVALYRKKKLIQEAKLIIKKGAKEYEKLIYWKFD